MSKKEMLLHRIPAPFLPNGLIRFINKYERFIMYGIIGGGALVIDVGLFWFIDATTDVSVFINNGVSIFFAMVYSFLANAIFNFRTRDGLLKRFISFVAVTSCGFIISSAMLWLMSNVLGMDRVLVKNLTLPVVFVVQFTLNSRFTFKVIEKKEDIALESVV